MNRIETIFGELRAHQGKGLMPFVCGGWPRAGVTERLIPAIERAGGCIVEVGIPFSDPIADGPVIAAAMHEALGLGGGRGATPWSVFEEIGRSRAAGAKAGVVAMMSVSIAWRVGTAELVKRASAAGIDGFIFPDLPVEEGASLIGAVRGAGMTASLLVAPTTPRERVERIVRACSGFVYVLARAGITGESGGLPNVAGRVAMIRELTDLPVACGFGISTAEQVRHVVRNGGADAAIVGSALVRRMADAERETGDAVEAAGGLVRELAAGLR